jgi:threonylcarbamoyladenosine tRNA methylthiotransferase MtaB
MMEKRVAFKTLGCRLNQFETDSIAFEFKNNGYEVVDFSDQADVYVINTCTVTNQSDHKSRNLISQAINKQGSTLVVTGCMATSDKERLEARKGVTYVVENDKKSAIFSLVEGHENGEILHPNDFEKNLFGYPAAGRMFHTRSMIKIQDGCDNFCTFCIIPFVRGRAVSRPVEDILENIKKVIDYGFKEIVLTGVNIGRYQYKLTNFEQLVERILKVPGDFRVRISSIEPDGYGDRLLELFADPKLMPHLHLCLQSGSDQVLLRMRRMYTVSEYMKKVEKLREMYPGFNVTTDIMVGFPGETEKDFSETIRIAKEAAFSHIHTFKFSKRKGTRADRMTDQVPEKIKNQRSEVIRMISDENKLQYRKSFIGSEQKVLIEKVDGNRAFGYGEHYVPVEFHTDKHNNNELVGIDIESMRMNEEPILTGRPI